jgi:hypothetical protein
MVMEKENNNNHNNMYHDKDQACSLKYVIAPSLTRVLMKLKRIPSPMSQTTTRVFAKRFKKKWW